MTIDVSDFANLSAAIETAGKRLPQEARKSTFKAALNIKEGARSRVSGSPYWKGLARTINFDVIGNAVSSQAEVGYDDEGQGELAGIAEFGSARHAPHPALVPAAKAEAPRFEKAMEDLAGKVLDL